LIALLAPPSFPEPGRPAPDRRIVEPAIRIPAATGWLIAINVLIHVLRYLAVRNSVLSPEQDDALVNLLGFDPVNLEHPFRPATILSLITYQFIHGGWDHLAANMVSLLAFGPGIERPLGRTKFLAIYFLTGIVAALTQAAFTPAGVHDVLIGASGSISGVFGALIVVWGVHRRGQRPLGIVRMVLLWSVLMAITGILGVGASGSPVAWIAHIGGFVAGIAFGFAFRPKTQFE